MADRTMQFVLWCLIVSALVSFVCALWFVLQNTGSRNIALAFSTFIGAIAFFGLQLYFDLQPTSEHTRIDARYTVDLITHAIRERQRPGGIRVRCEGAASQWLAEHNPKMLRFPTEAEIRPWIRRDSPIPQKQELSENLEEIGTDLTVFSFLYMLFGQEIDWHVGPSVFQDQYDRITSGTGVTDWSDCTKLSFKEIRLTLSQKRNLFSDVPFFPVDNLNICLPPQSTISVVNARQDSTYWLGVNGHKYPAYKGGDKVVLRNPYCQISLHPTVISVHLSSPRSGSESANAGPLFTRTPPQSADVLAHVDIDVYFFALRSQSRKIGMYRDWTKRIVKEAQEWWDPSDILPLGAFAEPKNPEENSRQINGERRPGY